MIGQSITNAISPAIVKIAQNHGLMGGQQHRNTYDFGSSSGAKSLLDVAEAFLGSSRPGRSAAALGVKTQAQRKDAEINWLPTIRQLTPGANSNFGIPKGEGLSSLNIESSTI